MRHLLLILFGALGCPEPPEERQKDCIDHLDVLYLNGNKDEALEAAQKLLKTGIKNEKKDFLNESPMTVFSHAFLAMVQFKVRDAERLFELAATKFQKTGKIKEASISYAEQGNSAILLGKFKESDQSLKMATKLLEGNAGEDLPGIKKHISEVNGRLITMIILAKSDADLKMKMELQSKETTTPISLQYDTLNSFGNYFMSTGEYEIANFCFTNALHLVETGLLIPEDARKEIQKNLEKVRLKLKDEKAP